MWLSVAILIHSWTYQGGICRTIVLAGLVRPAQLQKNAEKESFVQSNALFYAIKWRNKENINKL
jgi:hypothetical protein